MGELASALDERLTLDPAGLSDAELIEACDDTVVALRRLTAQLVSVLAVARDRGAVAAQTGYSPREFLTEDLRCGPGEAGQWLALSRRLPDLPLVTAAFTAGTLSSEHVRILTQTVCAVPAGPGRDALAAALVDIAATGTTTESAAAITTTRVLLGLDDDADAARLRAQSERSVALARTFDGWWTGRFLLPPEAGAALLAALDAIDPTTTTIGADSAGGGGAGDGDGDRDQAGDRDGEAVEPDDQRSTTQRRADALTALANQALAHADLPDQHGERPRICVVIDWQFLHDGIGVATLDGVPIPAATARRLACDAQLLPAVLNAAGEVLHLGHARRLFSTAQRRAGRLVNGPGCAFGTCPRPVADWHHLTHWADGGPTDLDNAAPVCHFHHVLFCAHPQSNTKAAGSSTATRPTEPTCSPAPAEDNDDSPPPATNPPAHPPPTHHPGRRADMPHPQQTPPSSGTPPDAPPTRMHARSCSAGGASGRSDGTAGRSVARPPAGRNRAQNPRRGCRRTANVSTTNIGRHQRHRTPRNKWHHLPDAAANPAG